MTDTRRRTGPDVRSRRPDAVWPADPGALDAPTARPTRHGDRRPPPAPGPQPRGRGRRPARPLHARATSARAPTRSPSGPGSPPAPCSATSRTPTTWPARRSPASSAGPCRCLPLDVGADGPLRRPGGAPWSTSASGSSPPSARPPTCPACGRPFQPRLAESLAEGRRFLRGQVRTLFAAELVVHGRRAEPSAALAAADVLTSFESYQLLTGDQGLDLAEARTVLDRRPGRAARPRRRPVTARRGSMRHSIRLRLPADTVWDVVGAPGAPARVVAGRRVVRGRRRHAGPSRPARACRCPSGCSPSTTTCGASSTGSPRRCSSSTSAPSTCTTSATAPA